MPTIIKLPPEEVKAIQDKGKSQRQLVAEQYDALLADFTTGDWGNVTLDPDEARPIVRNRLGAAAERRGIALRFARGRGDLMRFQVVAAGEGDADAEAEAEATLAPVVEPQDTAPAVVPPAVPPVPETPAPVAETEPPRKRGGRPKKVQAPVPIPEPPAPSRRGGRRRKVTDTEAEW